MACTPGHVLVGPYQGVHSRAFTDKHGGADWEDRNALTICLPAGSRVTAVGRGQILDRGYGPWTRQGKRIGSRLHLLLDSGEQFFYGYLSRLVAGKGDRVERNDVLGLSGVIRGAGALHFAAKPPVSPYAWYGSAFLLPGQGGAGASPGAGAHPGGGAGDSNTDLPEELEKAWDTLEYALRKTWPHASDVILAARAAGHKAVY